MGSPEEAQALVGPSSVWKAAFSLMRDGLGSGAHLANPYMNRVIAGSGKKTGRAGASALADTGRSRHRRRAAPPGPPPPPAQP